MTSIIKPLASVLKLSPLKHDLPDYNATIDTIDEADNFLLEDIDLEEHHDYLALDMEEVFFSDDQGSVDLYDPNNTSEHNEILTAGCLHTLRTIILSHHGSTSSIASDSMLKLITSSSINNRNLSTISSTGIPKTALNPI